MTELLQMGRSVLDQQPLSRHLGTELVSFEEGSAVLGLAIHAEFLQQHGFVHGGIISYLMDNAITFAGGSVLGANVVTVEFKINYIRPARGQRLVAKAVVEGSGTKLAVCRCEVVSLDGEKESRCAVGQGTIAVLG